MIVLFRQKMYRHSICDYKNSKKNIHFCTINSFLCKNYIIFIISRKIIILFVHYHTRVGIVTLLY